MQAGIGSAELPSCLVLGTPFSVTSMDESIDHLTALVDRRTGGYVCAADVHSVMVARDDPSHRAALHGAQMVLADGVPIVVTLRFRGHLADRVAGPDFMLEAFRRGQALGWRHFLLGAAQPTLKDLVSRLSAQFGESAIAGWYSPPFRELTPAEEGAVLSQIRDSKADIVWVGLGCPKQERWMSRAAAMLPGVVQIGVGAAFDFHSGAVKRAPVAMREAGFEWLHRLLSNPRRLWRRYLLLAPRFIAAAVMETVAQKGDRRTRAVMSGPG